MQRLKWFTIAFSLTCVLFGHTTAKAQPKPFSMLYGDSKIDDEVIALMEADKIVGLGLAIIYDGEVVYTQGYGDEDSEKGILVNPNQTRFRWASVSKTLTALLAVKADTNGQLELDKNIEYYYPDYVRPNTYLTQKWPGYRKLPSWAGPITMQRILTHTSGIQHYNNGTTLVVPPRKLINSSTTNTGMEWALSYWIFNPLVHVPGLVDDYSTPAFNLAGVALERSMGDNFDNLVQEYIAGPADMDTLRPDTNWNQAPRRAAGYRTTSNGSVIRDGDDDVSWKLAAGGYISTVSDMGRYAAALLRGDLLSPTEWQTMTAQQANIDGVPLPTGLAWFRGSGGTRLSHSGDQQKAQSLLTIYENEKLAIAIMSNTRVNGKSANNALGAIRENVLIILRQRLVAGDPVIQEYLNQLVPVGTQLYFVAPYVRSF